ncbi:MAG: conjugal transfer protein TraF [Pseudoruegeria sp.]
MKALVLAALPLCLSSFAFADSYGDHMACEDNRTSGWNFYCDTTPEIEDIPKSEEDPVAAIPQELPPVSYTDEMMAYRKALEEMKHKAILHPTPENVTAYMEAQQAAVKKASTFTEVWQRQLFNNPALDANVKRPLTTIGNNLRQDYLVADREGALRDAAQENGLLYAYDGPDICMICEAQAQILSDMAERYEIGILPVSTDGFVSPYFPASQIDQGQLSKLDLADTPRPFLALVDPATDEVQLIGAGLMTQDIILNRIRIITRVPEGELYE